MSIDPALLICEGPCNHYATKAWDLRSVVGLPVAEGRPRLSPGAYEDVRRWQYTPHRYVGKRWSPFDAEVVYQCASCGTQRRFGVE